MENNALSFGDIFEYDNKDYIFLAANSDINYVAKILSVEDSKRLNCFCNSQISKNISKTDTWLYCFIVLTTEEIKDRAAQFAKPELDEYNCVFHKRPIVLNDNDLNNLKNEILNTRATPIALKEIIKTIEIVTKVV